MQEFADQVVIISGAGRGIGRQHALFFAQAGAKVVVNDFGGDLRGANTNNAGPANEVVEKITAAGGVAVAAVCDIADPAAVDAMVADAMKRWGRVDVAIHNATTFVELSPFDQASKRELATMVGVNLNGGWNLAQACWPHMRQQKYGRIVMTGSAAGYFGRLQDHAYSTAKGALMPLVKVLAAEGAEFGIKVNMMAPVAATENAIEQKFPLTLADYATPEQISVLVAALSHRDCPVSGRMFHNGGGYIGEVFIAETVGKMFLRDELTIDSVIASMPEICDRKSFITPATTDDSAFKLLQTLSAAYPELAGLMTNG